MCRGALDAARLIDDPFEYPDDGVPLEGTARLLSVRPHVPEHFGFPIGLIDLETQLVLQLSNLQRAVRALVQQLDQPFIELIDPQSELVDGHQCVV